MGETFNGFDWDAGNTAKCASHGVSRAAIEALFNAEPAIAPDLDHSATEQRLIAVGRIPPGQEEAGRPVFVAFTIRISDGARLIRPISARFMHSQEFRRYEQEETDQSARDALRRGR